MLISRHYTHHERERNVHKCVVIIYALSPRRKQQIPNNLVCSVTWPTAFLNVLNRHWKKIAFVFHRNWNNQHGRGQTRERLTQGVVCVWTELPLPPPGFERPSQPNTHITSTTNYHEQQRSTFKYVMTKSIRSVHNKVLVSFFSTASHPHIRCENVFHVIAKQSNPVFTKIHDMLVKTFRRWSFGTRQVKRRERDSQTTENPSEDISSISSRLQRRFKTSFSNAECVFRGTIFRHQKPSENYNLFAASYHEPVSIDKSGFAERWRRWAPRGIRTFRTGGHSSAVRRATPHAKVHRNPF